MSQYNDTGKRAFLRPNNPADYVKAYLRVKIDADGVLSAAGDEADLGVIYRDMHQDYDHVNVEMTTKPGTVMVQANGAVAVGAPVYCVAGGKVGPAGTRQRGVALSAASSDGDVIEISNLHPPI